jgi:hypothetical protein
MNFKTTIILLIVLLAVAGAFFYTGAGAKKPQGNEQANPVLGVGAKVLDVNPEDVVAMTITAADGKQTILKKTDTGWRLSAPVDAASPAWAASGFISAFAQVTSSGHPEDQGVQTGLDKPAYHVDFQTSDGKITTLNLGNKNSLGDLVYAQVSGGEVNLIPASLEDGLENIADQLRDRHLFNSQTLDARQIWIEYGGTRITLARDDGQWKILGAEELPGDAAQIASLVNSMLNAEAAEFVKPDSPDLQYAGFDHPTLTIWASAQAPSTQPTTGPSTAPSTEPADLAGGVSLIIGAPTSLAKDNYFAKSSDGLIAKVPSSVLDSLQKTPLDLRDRNVLNIAPQDVTQISILHETLAAGKQPVGLKPQVVSTQKVLLVRRPVQAPVTAATQPATAAAQSIWEFGNSPSMPVDDVKVAALLANFKPLHAESYRASPPTGSPTDETFVELTTKTAVYQLKFDNYVEGAMPIGSYGGLTFDLSSDLMDTLTANFRLSP